MRDSLADFERGTFSHDGTSKDVFRTGHGPGILVMTEIPGITPEVAALARILSDDGFTVVMPDLVGTPGKAASAPYTLRSIARVCISREFAVLAGHRRSPVTDWLRALARSLHAELGGPGIGAIGMCVTGNFALSLLLDEALVAPVLSQPSLPFPITAEKRCSLHLGDDELEVVKRRVADQRLTVLGMRFTADRLCPGERFQRLKDELGSAFEAIEIDSSPGNAHGIPSTAHSVVTADFVDEEGHPTVAARNRLREFFRERLQHRRS